jgi:hypothetical protein
MSLSTQPPVSPGEDLDGLLRAFYQAQLPHPWPDFKVPDAGGAPSARLRRFALLRSRLTLAASVALLFSGSFLLPRQAPQQTGPEVEIRSPTATNTRPGSKISVYLEQRQGEPTRIKADMFEELPPGK